MERLPLLVPEAYAGIAESATDDAMTTTKILIFLFFHKNSPPCDLPQPTKAGAGFFCYNSIKFCLFFLISKSENIHIVCGCLTTGETNQKKRRQTDLPCINHSTDTRR